MTFNLLKHSSVGAAQLVALLLCTLAVTLPARAAKKINFDEFPPAIVEIIDDDEATDPAVARVVYVKKVIYNEKNSPTDLFISHGRMGHFTWGVDVASGVDLTSHDMTMVQLSGCFGYKGGIWRFLGVGATVMNMMNNDSRCYPIYAMARTSFSRQRRFCFVEAKVGPSFNTMYGRYRQTDLFSSLGVGFTLAHSRNFSSHIVLSGVAMPLKKVTPQADEIAPNLNYIPAFASIAIGFAF